MNTYQIFIIAGLFAGYYAMSDKGRPIDFILMMAFFIISYWLYV